MSTASSVQQMTLPVCAGALMIVFGPFCIGHFLVIEGKCFAQNDHNFYRLIGSVGVVEPGVLHAK
jgi:hypothetical protein